MEEGTPVALGLLEGVGLPPMAGDAVMREMLVTRIKTNIERALENRHNLDQMIDAQVEVLRLLGCSWQVVGQTLGMSKQAASKKYGHLDQAVKTLGLQVPEGD